MAGGGRGSAGTGDSGSRWLRGSPGTGGGGVESGVGAGAEPCGDAGAPDWA